MRRVKRRKRIFRKIDREDASDRRVPASHSKCDIRCRFGVLLWRLYVVCVFIVSILVGRYHSRIAGPVDASSGVDGTS